MNERINELAEQAGYNPVWNTKADKEEYFDKEKFAELIVKECAKVCSGKYYYSDQMSKQCGINFAKDIKEHFGVEE